MHHTTLDKMVKGWFVGNFEPSILRTDSCEVAVKHYQTGDYEERHQHRIATEITVIISGQIVMCGKSWSAGTIILLEPGEITDFKALENTTTVVIKLPGATNDKYIIND